MKMNPYFPDMIFDKIEGNDMTNFFNVWRIRDDIPFIKINDLSVSIGFPDEISF